MRTVAYSVQMISLDCPNGCDDSEIMDDATGGYSATVDTIVQGKPIRLGGAVKCASCGERFRLPTVKW